MRFLKILILFFSLSVLFQLATTSANATGNPPCLVNADGEIDVGARDTDGTVKDDCSVIPALYEIIIYEAYLCTSEAIIPTATTAADLSMCTKVFENPDGAVASVAQDKNIDLVGLYKRPANGVYTHSYAKIDNTFGLTWAGKLDANMKSSTSVGNDEGPFCGTVAGSGTFQNGFIHTNSMICGTSAITPGKFVETMKSFSNDSDQAVSGLIEDVPGNPGATIQGIMTDVNGFASTGNADSSRLEATMKNGKTVIIDKDTRGLAVKFSLVAAMDLKEENRNDRIEASSGPFISIMTAIQPRARGSWR
jgi:hypothetical protein